jgi:tetraacyldisaccharide 4'-kinase
VRLQHGAAQFIAAAPDAAGLEVERSALESTMKRLAAEEEAKHGRDVVFADIQDERGWFEIQSERDRPPLWLRGMASLHGVAVRLDRRLRPRPTGRGGRPWVIGVGNLEAGGTGKTPCVIELARGLAARGERVAVLTRGHGGSIGGDRPVACDPRRLPAGASDETRLLVDALASVARVVASRSKRKGLDWLRHAGVDVVLVDDAFQTVGLPVDRHLVLLDWARPLGNGWLLPAGRLREPPTALRRADALLFTRAREARLPQGREWSHLPTQRLFLAREVFLGLVRPAGERVDPSTLRGTGVAVLSGIGRPQAFEALVHRLAAQHAFSVRRTVRVGDHAPLEPALGKLAGRLEALEARQILLTRKDVMRLSPARESNEPLLVVEQRLAIEALETLLAALLP